MTRKFVAAENQTGSILGLHGAQESNDPAGFEFSRGQFGALLGFPPRGLMPRRTSIACSDDLGSRDGLETVTVIPANARQRKIAFYAFIVLIIIAIANAPLARVQLGRYEYFVPFIHTAMSIAAFLTAALLFAQYSVYPRRALLFVACGFVCSGSLALMHLVSFPSASGSRVLIGDKLNSPTWLIYWWQTLFPLAVILYSVSKDKTEADDRSRRSVGTDIGIAIASAFVVTAAAVSLTSAVLVKYLPPLHEDLLRRTQFALGLSVFVSTANVTALAVLFVHRRTLLDQWLMVVLLAWLPALVMGSFFSTLRFSEVWYLSWLYALFTSSSLLFVLLTETLLLYRRSYQHQKLLIAELDHRVKNVLAQVAAIAASTRQGSRSMHDFFRSLEGRIQSMAAAHTLLSEGRWQNVGLEALVRNQLAPYTTETNLTVDGAEVMLNSAETQVVAKVLHELATNAAKYGALSTPAGQISVSWGLKLNPAATKLIIFWREHGGPTVASDRPSGFGTNLIRNLIPHELGGTVDLAFEAVGTKCRIEIPLHTGSL